MERTLTYRITAQKSNLTVSSYLKQHKFSTRNLIALKKHADAVTVDGKPVYMNYRLQTGEALSIHIHEEASSEKIIPVELPLEIVYEDADLLVINKPAGMPMHPSMNNYDNSAANALAWHYAKQGIPFVFRCINRLDRDTSGLAIIAKHYVCAGILGEYVSASAVTREYLAIVRGCLTPAAGVISAPISRKEGSVLERQVDFAKGESAITRYRLLEERNGHSLVSLQLETGRTHQIRVHMKYLGFPLIGDYLYNPDTEWINRQALHSYKLSFPHPITDKLMEFIAPLPKDMTRVLDA